MKFVVFFIILFIHSLLSYGQADTTLNIHEIDISDSRLQNISQTGRVIIADTSTITRINAATLTDVLGQSSAVFSKDNGGSRLATISIRGTTASQNTLTWNGLAINTPTLGLSDVSLIPSFFIDDVAIQYGGNGSLNGSAAIGGAIHLSSRPVFNAGWQGKIFLSNASFNDYQQGVSVSYSGGKYFARTAFFHHTAENNYSFRDAYVLNFPERTQTHAFTQQNGFLEEQFLLLKKDLFSMRCMYLDADREIPPLMGTALYQSDQSEKDEQLKLVTEWKHYEGQLQTMIRVGLLDDKIIYRDDKILLDDRSHGINIQPEAEAVYHFGKHQFQGGITAGFAHAHDNSILGNTVQGYPGNHSLNRSSVYISYNYKISAASLFTVSLRKEIEKGSDYPLLPAAGIRFHLYKQLYIYSNAAAVYRTPTLNDLYWTPGGNPQLKPEQGYQSDLRLQNHAVINNFLVDADAGVYYMHINDWIQWVPDNSNNYSPLNIEKVTSKGVESSGNITYHLHNWKTVTGYTMEYTLAANKNGFGISTVAGKQLVYTPKINWSFAQSVSLHHSTLQFQYHFTGYRYTTADNSSWLEPYGIINCSLSQELKCRFGNIYITAGVNNLTDINYEVVALHPMPGRWYRLSVLLNVETKK